VVRAFGSLAMPRWGPPLFFGQDSRFEKGARGVRAGLRSMQMRQVHTRDDTTISIFFCRLLFSEPDEPAPAPAPATLPAAAPTVAPSAELAKALSDLIEARAALARARQEHETVARGEQRRADGGVLRILNPLLWMAVSKQIDHNGERGVVSMQLCEGMWEEEDAR